MTGIYLKCDTCGKTLGGEEVTFASQGLHWSDTAQLQKAARELGWTGPLTRDSNSDRCPECSRERSERGRAPGSTAGDNEAP